MISGVSGGNNGSNLHWEIVQTGAGNNNNTISGAMTYQVAAYDANVGNHDGDGIDYVLLQVYYNGNKVYERQENNVAYCAFAGRAGSQHLVLPRPQQRMA